MVYEVKFDVFVNGEKTPYLRYKYSRKFTSRSQVFAFLQDPIKAEKQTHWRNFNSIKIENIEIIEPVFETKEIQGKEVTRKVGTQSFSPAKYQVTYCKICGRLLTDPNSVSRGIGPECIKKYSTHHSSPMHSTRVPNPYDNIQITVLSPNAIPIIEQNLNERQCSCGKTYHEGVWMTYNHSGGLILPSYNEHQWVFLQCNCGLQVAFNKLRHN
jgi:hypothetical protein